MRLLGLATGILLVTASLAEADLAERGNQAVEAWSQAAATFNGATATACPPPPATPDPAALATARSAFRDLAIRWQQARPWLVGPAASRDLPSQVWFWPDPHGSATRQIGKALASGEPQGLASTGLGLAEIVLFDDDPLSPVRCAMLREVGRTQAALGQETASTFTTTRLSATDRQRLLFVSMRDSLDRISQEKIDRPLGLDIQTARGQRAEAWRSGLSLDLIGASLDAVEGIYLPPDGVATRLADSEVRPQLDRILRDQFARTRRALADVAMPLDQAVSDPAGRAQVEALLHEVQQWRLLVVERLAPAIGETLGFNALDGD
ncbi:MAG TPA: imelysin family protein [Geminicoccus sp.]|jgi:hypothetical protein|uniref:imelysin family protein n=1 Tax=Geminicoccus sp. TaxID=2024832 RepID=UPI002E33A1E9|nr:imelysin family protein [Geminicoccus sp.]HEX2528283.1 imelysin family protein [Geminicoccus sp.]